jgi:hypothetical protein
MTSEEWANKWLYSKEFRLMEIDMEAAASLNINAAASPHPPKNPNRVQHYLHCSVDSLDPIVVDVNKRRTGRSYLGYIPPVVVLDGKHRKMAQLHQGRTRILAWVGASALKLMPKSTVHEVDEKVNPIRQYNVDEKTLGIKQVPYTGVKLQEAYELFAATVPSVGMPTMRQDSGEGGSRPKDSMHSGGPGSGRKPYKWSQSKTTGLYLYKSAGYARGYSGGTYGSISTPYKQGGTHTVTTFGDNGFKKSANSLDEAKQMVEEHMRQQDAKKGIIYALGGTGEGGSRPKDHIHSGGPGSGRHPSGVSPVKEGKLKDAYKQLGITKPSSSKPVNSLSHKGLTEAGWKHSNNLADKKGDLSVYTHRTIPGEIRVRPSGRTHVVHGGTGSGGSRPKDSMHSGGPGSGIYNHKKTIGLMKQSGLTHYSNNPRGLGVGVPESGFSHKDGGYYNVDKQTGEWDFGRGKSGKSAASGSDGDSLYRHVQRNYGSLDAMGGPGVSNQGGANVVNANEDSSCGCGCSGKLHKSNGARSSGSIKENSFENEIVWDGQKAKNYVPGTGPGYTDRFGSPNFQAPGSGVGQRVKNKGAANSDYSRVLAKGKMIKKIFNKRKG